MQISSVMIGSLVTIVLFMIGQAIALAKWAGGIQTSVALMKQGQDLLTAAVNARAADQRSDEESLKRHVDELANKVHAVEMNLASCAACNESRK